MSDTDDVSPPDFSVWNMKWMGHFWNVWRVVDDPTDPMLAAGFSKEVTDLHMMMEEFRLVRSHSG
jgi:hypothetical protein